MIWKNGNKVNISLSIVSVDCKVSWPLGYFSKIVGHEFGGKSLVGHFYGLGLRLMAWEVV